MTALAIALLIMGPSLLVAEAHLPTGGALGVAGTAALVGGIVLAVVDSGGSAGLAVALALPVALACIATVLIAARGVLALRGKRAHGGAQDLIGHVGMVRRPLDPLGQIAIDGELWRARRSWADDPDGAPLVEGEPVVVERVQGLTLSVRRAEEWEIEP